MTAETNFLSRSRKKETTMKKLTNQACVLAALAMALMPQMMPAQAPVPPAGSRTLDDFTKGADTIHIVTGNVTKSYTEPAKEDHIIGGTRGSNNEAGGCGINLAPLPGPFTVDFPLDNFALSTTGVDFSNTEALLMVFQDSPDLAITGFYAVPPGSAPATYTACPKS
jgi:hypothetical protein